MACHCHLTSMSRMKNKKQKTKNKKANKIAIACNIKYSWQTVVTKSSLYPQWMKAQLLKALACRLKVIPLKLFYYQTFFETWRNEHSWYEHYKNAIKIWGHRACLPVSRFSKWGINFLLVARWKFESPSYRIKSWLLERHKVLSWK